jgi:PKD repeat protein
MLLYHLIITGKEHTVAKILVTGIILLFIGAYATSGYSTDIPQQYQPTYLDWSNEPPVANFTYLINNLSVTFDGTLSYDPDGTIVTWLWEFGDGTEGAGIIVTHDYPTSGTYNVTLTVIDDDDEKGNITKSITVETYQEVFIFGSFSNQTYIGDTIQFEADNIRVITFQPFSFIPYRSGEHFTILKTFRGYVGTWCLFAFCDVLI